MAVRAGDLAGLKDTSGPIPEGRHTAQIVDARETRNNGREVWELKFRIVAGAAEGRELREWLYFTPHAAIRMQYLMDAVGVDIRSMPKHEGVSASMALNKLCDIDLVHKEREVNDRNNPGAKKRMTFAEIDFNGFHKASGAQAPAQQAGNTAAAVASLW